MAQTDKKEGIFGRALSTVCSLALVASLSPVAAISAFAADDKPLDANKGNGTSTVQVVVQYKNAAGDNKILIDENLTLGGAGNVQPAISGAEALYYNPNTATGNWGVVTTKADNYYTLNSILKAANLDQNNADSKTTAYKLFGEGSKITFSDCDAIAPAEYTTTYSKLMENNQFFGSTSKVTLNTSNATTVLPGIAKNNVYEAQLGSVYGADGKLIKTAGALAEALLDNTAFDGNGNLIIPTTNQMQFIHGVSEANAQAAKNTNLSTFVDTVKRITITIAEPDVATRIEGETWADTMAKICEKGWEDGQCSDVVVATTASYQDALSAAGLAGLLGCPVLLTEPNALNEITAEQINRIAAGTGIDVWVIGGEYVINESVITELEALRSVYGMGTVTRIAGETAWDTALAIFNAPKTYSMVQNWRSKGAIICTAQNFQDALSMSPVAAKYGMPIFLTNSENVLSDDVAAAINKKGSGINNIFIAGGPIAVTFDVDNQVNGKYVQRLYGQDGYQTSNAIASYLYKTENSNFGFNFRADFINSQMAGIATGENFLDALCAGPYLGQMNKAAVLLLVSSDNTYCIDNFLTKNAAVNGGVITKATVFGGPIAVSDATLLTIETAIDTKSNTSPDAYENQLTTGAAA